MKNTSTDFFKDKKHLCFFALGIVLLVTAFIYVPSRNYELIDWDDHIYITNNELIRDISPEGIVYILFGPTHIQGTRLTLISFAIDYAIGGLNPAVYRTHNIILYLLGIVVLFVFIRKLFSRYDLALLVVTLFAVLSTHIESVVWVSQRKDMLYFLFFFLSLLAYLKYLDNKKNAIAWLILSFFLFFLSFHAKVAAAPLALILFLIDYYKKRPFSWRLILDKTPHIAFFLFYSIRYSTPDAAPVSMSFEMGEETLSSFGIFSLTDRIFLGSYAFIYYIKMFFYPHPIYFIHPYPTKIDGSLPTEYYISFFIAVLLTVAVVYLLYKIKTPNKRQLIFGLLFFMINIALYLHVLVDIKGVVVVADRYTYVAYVGLLIVVASIIIRLLNAKKKPYKKNMLRLALFVYAILFIQHTIVAKTYIKAWKDDLTVFNDLIAKNPNVFHAYNNRGIYYVNNNELEKALKDFNRAIELNPNMAYLYNNRGATYVKLEMYEKALPDLQISLKLNPDDKSAQFNIAKCLLFLEQSEESLKAFDKYFERNLENADAWNDRGKALNEMGHYHDAIYSLNKALSLDSTQHLAYNNRGIAYAHLYEYDKAMSDFHKALELDSTYSDPYMNIGTILALNNYFADAVNYYNIAIDLLHHNPYVYMNRAACYFELNEIEKACMDWEIAYSLGVTEALYEFEQYCR